MKAMTYIVNSMDNGRALMQFAKAKASDRHAPKSLERYLLGALLNRKTRRPDKD